MEPGAKVVLFDGSGLQYQATITAVSKSEVVLNCEGASDPETESPLHIELWQCVSKGSRMDTAIQKATELGVSCIRPVFSEHGIVKLDSERANKRVAHWQEVAISACEQSGRTCVPDILPPEKLTSALESLDSTKTAVMFTPHATGVLDSVAPDTESLIVLIGPEGGFSPTEHQLAIDRGVSLVRIGNRVLRTETAPVAILGVLQYLYGDLKS